MNGRTGIGAWRAGIPLATVGLWSFVVAVAFIWVPGYWVDEAVTVVMAGRDWQDFLATLRGADAVHAFQ